MTRGRNHPMKGASWRPAFWDLRISDGKDIKILTSQWAELEWRALGHLLENIDEHGTIAGHSEQLADLNPEGEICGRLIVEACLLAVSEVYGIDDLEQLAEGSERSRRGNLFYSMMLDVWNDVIGAKAAPPASSGEWEKRKTELANHIHTLLRPALQRQQIHLPEPFHGDRGFLVVSYARADLVRVAPFLNRVVSWGFLVWYDRGIPGGVEWDAMIEQQVARSDGVLFFLSEMAASSRWVRREVKFADFLEKHIVIVGLEPVSRFDGLNMLLTQYQIIDGTRPTWQAELRASLDVHRRQ